MKRLALAQSVHLLQRHMMWVYGRAFHTCAVAWRFKQFHDLLTSLHHLAFITSAITAAGKL